MQTNDYFSHSTYSFLPFQALIDEQDAMEAATEAAYEAQLAEQDAMEAAAEDAYEAQLAEQEAMEAEAEAAYEAQLAEQDAMAAAAEAVYEAQLAEQEVMAVAAEASFFGSDDDCDSDDCFEYPVHKEWHEELGIPEIEDFASQFECEDDFNDYMESRF